MAIKNSLSLAISCLAAIALGWVLLYLQFYAMQLFIPVTPVPRLLHELGLDGPAFSIALYPFDFVFHVISSLPVAIAIYALRPRHLALYTALAVLPYFFALFGAFLVDGTLGLSVGIVQTGITTLLVLPIAVLLVHWVFGMVRPNSFKRPCAPHPSTPQ